MKNTRKILSVLLAVVMVLSILPIAAVDSFAVTSEDGLWEYYGYEQNPVTKIAQLTKYKGNETDLVIPSVIDGYTVTSLGPNLLNAWQKQKINSLVIPDTVTTIENSSTFSDCTSLLDIVLPNTLNNVNGYLFDNTAYSNDEENWQEGVLYIGKYLFVAKNDITNCNVKEGTIGILNYAFRDSTIENIEFPDSLTFIGEAAFRDCKDLKDFVLPDELLSIGNYAFYGCSSLINLTIPNNITIINEYCFAWCMGLKNVVISDSVVQICTGAFTDVTLDYLYIGSGMRFGGGGFNGVDYFETYYFPGCFGLHPTVLHYGEDITEILGSDFSIEPKLQTVYLSKTVSSLPEAFLNFAPNLQEYIVDEDNPYYSSVDGVIYNKDKTELVRYPQGKDAEIFEIPNGVVTLKSGAISNAPSVKILIPPSVKNFEDGWIDGNYGGSIAGQRTIYGYTGTAAEAYAKQRGYIFIPLNPFADVPYNAWFLEAVKYSKEKGFITGYGNGNFGGADKLQRQDFIVILGRIVGFDNEVFSHESMYCELADVVQSAYYAPSVNWSVYRNIIKGYENGKFGVGDSITREQVATILYRYMGSPEVTGADETLAPFADAGRISNFAKDAMVWAVQNGVISGKNATTLAPTDSTLRAEIATIIMHMDKAGMFD